MGRKRLAASRIHSLPEELLWDVFDRLNAVDGCAFGAVCRGWRDLEGRACERIDVIDGSSFRRACRLDNLTGESSSIPWNISVPT